MNLPVGYEIREDPAQMDLAAIHAFLTQSYWARGIPVALVERALRHSMPFGLFHDGAQIGFARVITDRATFAYLADVYVDVAHRGRGLSKALLQHILGHAELQGLRRFLLATLDAHGLYAQFGFKPLAAAAGFMEIHVADRYRSPHEPSPPAPEQHAARAHDRTGSRDE